MPVYRCGCPWTRGAIMAKMSLSSGKERRTGKVHHVKYLLNDREPGATELAHEMRKAGVRLTTLPTSGPLTIIVDGFASYGPEGVQHVADRLIAIERDRTCPGT